MGFDACVVSRVGGTASGGVLFVGFEVFLCGLSCGGTVSGGVLLVGGCVVCGVCWRTASGASPLSGLCVAELSFSFWSCRAVVMAFVETLFCWLLGDASIACWTWCIFETPFANLSIISPIVMLSMDVALAIPSSASEDPSLDPDISCHALTMQVTTCRLYSFHVYSSHSKL